MEMTKADSRIAEALKDFLEKSLRWSPTHISSEGNMNNLKVRIKGYSAPADACFAEDEWFSELLKETRLETFLSMKDQLKASINHITGLDHINIYPDISTASGDLILFITCS